MQNKYDTSNTIFLDIFSRTCDTVSAMKQQTKPSEANTMRGMNYDEAVESTVSREQAIREIRKHGQSDTEFYLEMGYKETYNGGDVLAWLGY